MDEDMIEEAGAALLNQAGKGVLIEVQKTGGDLFRYLLGNRVSEWQTKNMINMAARTAAHFQERGIDISQAKSLPNAEIYALFQGASVTDDPDLSEMWSKLLASGMDPETDETAPIALSSVLASMDGNDARLFQGFVQSLEGMKQLRAYEAELHRKLLSEFPRSGPRDQDTASRRTARVEEHQELLAKEKSRITRESSEAIASHKAGFEHSKANLCRFGLIRPDLSKKFNEGTGVSFGRGDFQDRTNSEIAMLKEKLAKLQRQTIPSALVSASDPEPGPLVRTHGAMSPHYHLTNLGTRLAKACM